jgi:UDP:flavonoid glycosyltransferase YjiC (YdhE family)
MPYVPEPTKQALSRARIVLHHGGMLLAEETIAAGRPHLIVPSYLEQLLTAAALRALDPACTPATSGGCSRR